MTDAATIKLQGDKAPLKQTLDQGKTDVMSFASAAKGALAGIGAAFAIKEIFAFGKESIKAAAEVEQGETRLQAVLEATGHAAGVTLEEVKKLGEEVKKNTKYDDDAAVAAGKKLAVFKTIKGDIFKEAIRSSADLATVMGTDLPAATGVLGRALAFPEKAAGALRRAGIALTKDMSDQIKAFSKSGDIESAQKLILQAVKGSVGGAATKEMTTFSGQLERLSNDFGDLQESIGGALLPLIDQFYPAIKGGMDLLASFVQTIADFTTSTAKNFEGWGSTIKDTIGAAWRFMQEAGVYAFTALQTGWQNAGDTIMIGVDALALGVIKAFENIKHTLVVVIPTALDFLARNWKDIFNDIYEADKAIFSNLAINIGAFFNAVEGWFRGEGWNFQWTGLLDGFKRTTEEFPEIAERVKGETEKALESDLAERAARVGKAFGENLKDNMIAAFGDGETEAEKAAADAQEAVDLTVGEAPDISKKKKAKKDKAGGIEDLVALSNRIQAAAASVKKPEDKIADATMKAGDETKRAIEEQTDKLQEGQDEMIDKLGELVDKDDSIWEE